MSDENSNRAQMTQKTKMCWFYPRGKCMQGSGCTFAHSTYELRDREPGKAPSVCRHWLRGWCRSGSQCRFSHFKEYDEAADLDDCLLEDADARSEMGFDSSYSTMEPSSSGSSGADFEAQGIDLSLCHVPPRHCHMDAEDRRVENYSAPPGLERQTQKEYESANYPRSSGQLGLEQFELEQPSRSFIINGSYPIEVVMTDTGFVTLRL
eukprot:TRINITY_DN49127_c0_g1_i3.p2 TRINITY_DN49127_c0_g1~~TRINITY_DN49127_c0_g1_i3.p2  ORF type:complete len:208 (-),score=41.24 TRINITY_DN49127_c0_g1_i3:36-659(-)